jgi:hypothetical protein
LVFSIHDPTEVAIQKMIEANQRMININSQGGEAKDGGDMNPVMKRHRIRNQDSTKCSKRCRKVGMAFEKERMSKGGSNAH